MGYYSQTKIALKKADYEELKGRVELSNNKNLKSLFDYAEVEIGKEVIVMEFDWVKWYPEFEEVAFFEDFLSELDETGKPYKFIRVGEDQGDIEQMYSAGINEDWSCNEAISVCTYIETNI